MMRYILLFGFLLRLAFIGIYGDLKNDYYWEYGEISKNLVHGKGYSFFSIDGDSTIDRYRPNAEAFKSAFMPPGYVLFLAPYLTIENPTLRNILLLLTHLLLSTATIWLLYRVCTTFFSETVGLVAAGIGAVLPEFLYANLSFTPTVLYHFLILYLFLLIAKMGKGGWRIPMIGLVLAVLMYLRAEFVLFTALVLPILLFRKEILPALLIGAIAFGAILPWSVRNINTFNAFVPLTTGFGLNLYRGHNPHYVGNFGFDEVAGALKDVRSDQYEVVMSKEYQKLAVAYIKEHPGEVASNSILKFFWFFSYIPFYPESGNLLYLLPTIGLFLLSLYGVIRTFSWRRFWHFYLFFLTSTVVVVLFFPLPRYQTMMKILQLPFAAYGLLLLLSIWRKKERPELVNSPER
ncbi:MAG: hypothetical protein AB7H80_01215 [Candidatus Kapaibacterium sp.]